jgi:hypothetical protein
MTIVRPITPPQVAPAVLNVKSMAVSTTVPVGLSHDGGTVYGGNVNVLAFSVDDCTTWTTAFTFATGNTVRSLIETDDGEAICILEGGAAAPGYVYKSTGWSVSKTTATWALALTSAAGCYFETIYSVCGSNFGSNARVPGTGANGVICEYGPQTTGSAGTFATHIYFTTNYGTSWTLVGDYGPGGNLAAHSVAPDHCLGCAYDPWWDRIISTHQAGLSTEIFLMYSDDHGNTWNSIPLPAWDSAASGTQQIATTVNCLEDCYIFGNTHYTGGAMRMARLKDRTLGQPYQCAVTFHHTGSQGYTHAFRQSLATPDAPLLIAGSSGAALVPNYLLITRDGLNFTEVWRDDLMKMGGAGEDGVAAASPVLFFGPTQLGNIVGSMGPQNTPGGGTALVIGGELIEGRLGDFSQYLDVTGDGTTTVFSFPHYLPAAPGRYFVVPQSYNAVHNTAPVVTVTSTNIVLTYGAAPTSGAVSEFRTCYAP